MVFDMPSERAFAVIIAENWLSVPPSLSAMAAAASLADCTIMPSTASFTVMASPAFTRSLVGGREAAYLENGTLLSQDNSPRRIASNVMYSVIIFVSEAG
ncbi:hypothetical protein D3C87_1915030 [compost metagenome]